VAQCHPGSLIILRYRFGEEAADSARVWNLYRDRVTDIDDRRIDAWNDTLGILLVFVSVRQTTVNSLTPHQAGLFSAICTAFIIEVYKSLQTDWEQTTAFAVYAIWSHLNGSVPAGLVVPDPANFKAPRSVYWTNGLWFGSLSLSLIASLLAILARQWLGEYRSRVRTHAESVRHWAGSHMIYSKGLDKWHLDAVLATLPVLLHASLFMFLAGLILWLWNLDSGICVAVATLTVITVILYIVTTLLPLWFKDCPTATPLLTQGRRILSALRNCVARSMIWVWISGYISRQKTFSQSQAHDHIAIEFEPVPARQRRRSPEVNRESVQILAHMIRTFPAPQDVEVAIQAIAGIHPMSYELLRSVAPDLIDLVTKRLHGISTAGSDTGMRRLSALLRTMCALRIDLRDRSFEDLRNVTDAAAGRTTFDTFAIRVAMDLMHHTYWPNSSLRLLEEKLIVWFSRGTWSDSCLGHPILPETACRLLLSLQRQQSIKHSGWGGLFDIASIPLGMLAALSLSVGSDYSSNSFGEPLQTLLPDLVRVRTVGNWAPVEIGCWRSRAADAWSHVLTLPYMLRSNEEEQTVWQAYFGILKGFRLRPQSVVSMADLNRLLGSWATPRAISCAPTPAVADGIIMLFHALLEEDPSSWSPVMAGTYFNIFYLYGRQRNLYGDDLQKAATQLLAHITPMPPNIWRRAPAATSFWTAQGDGDETWMHNSILNLLHDFQPPEGPPISFWMLLIDLPELVPEHEPGLCSDFRYRVAMALLIKLVHIHRKGINISKYAHALLQNQWCEDLLLRPDSRDDVTSEAGARQFAQHACEVLPEWWTKIKHQPADSRDPDGMATRERLMAFTVRVEQEGRCTRCPDRITPRTDPHILAIHDDDNDATSPAPCPTFTPGLTTELWHPGRLIGFETSDR